MKNPLNTLNQHFRPLFLHLFVIGALISVFMMMGCASQDDLSQNLDISSKSSLTVQPGSQCSEGCVWSSWAVSSGFQSAERYCGNEKCACVVDGDISLSCTADDSKPNLDVESQSMNTLQSGASCGSGCIWSTYAVSQGLQSASADCDSGACACVVDGDAAQLCQQTGNGSGSMSSPEPQSPPAVGSGELPNVPYFYQYDNRLHPSASCQNTSIAMVLSYLGWRGTPDEITSRYGKDWAQSPEGLAALFNTYVEREGLSMRIQPHTSGSLSGLRAELDQGHPVIIHGYFTGYGHVLVVLGYDANGYYVNDPAGKWSEYFKGGYSGGGSGRGAYYGKAAFEAAVATSNGYDSFPLWYHALR